MKNKIGCIGFFLLVGCVVIGIGYVMRFVISPLRELIPDSYLITGFFVGLILIGISYGAASLGVVGVIKKRGEIHLTSPLWVDFSRWGGAILSGVSVVLGFSSPEESWIALLFNCLIIVLFTVFVIAMLNRIRKDLNDKMIIAEDYLSIDEEMSSEKIIINKSNILKIELYSIKIRSESFYIRIIHKSEQDGEEKELKYEFEPQDQLNIGRDVIVKYLLEKGYEPINI